MAKIYATAIPVVEPSLAGVHLAWIGPSEHPHSLSGWKVQRRSADRIPSACDRIPIGTVLAPEERSSVFGALLLKPGVFPAGGAPCTICTVELAQPASGLHGRIQSGIGCIVAVRNGKAVAGLGPLSGPFDLGSRAADTLIFYVAAVSADTTIELCQLQYDQSDWANAKVIADLQLPIREFMPGLTDEIAEAKARLMNGETIEPQRFEDLANLLRGLSLSPRGTILVRSDSADDFDEMSALDPIRMLYSSPKWRRVLGFATFDDDPDLVPGQSYDYRISATFPSASRVIGFHTIPSGTQLPSDFYLYDCRVRLPQPAIVELMGSTPSGALLYHTRRGIRLQSGGVALPWTGFSIDDYCAVIDLPFAAQSIRFELEPGHDLTIEAGSAWGTAFSAAIQIPTGPEPVVVLPNPSNQLRLRGKGFLSALIVEPGPDAPEVQILPAVTLADTPRPAPPISVTAESLQSAVLAAPAGIRPPPRPLGMNLEWEPTAMVIGWTIPALAAPLDAAVFHIERRIEPNGSWEPVLGSDSPVFGGRDSADDPPAVFPGADLMQAFPESAAPSGSDTSFTHEDLFLIGEEGESIPNPPEPGTMLRYQIASIDTVGRLSATFTQSDPARLEKHEPPPVPSGADPRSADLLPSAAPTGVTAKVLVSGGDLSPEEQALLGSSDNAILLEWGWHSNEREIDPFATHFRIYTSPPLNTVACEILTATEISGRPGAYRATATLTRDIDPDSAKGQYLNAGYPFFVEEHSGGSNIEFVLVTRIAAPGGGFRAPALGTTNLPLNYSSRFTRPDGWSERLLPRVPITAEEQFRFVLRDRLQLGEDHPRDGLWVGVSAADDQAYIPDTRPGPNALAGNESAVAAALCQGRWHGRPSYSPPPPAADAARIVAPEPNGGDVRFTFDLGPFFSGSGLAPGALIFPERLEAAELLDHVQAQGTDLLGSWESESSTIAIPNPQDRQAIISSLQRGEYHSVEDRYLVLLAALHPFRDRLFRPVHEGPLQPLAFDDVLPSSAGRYVYRLRAANPMGQLSAEGFVVPAVVRVPSTAPAPKPAKQPRRNSDPSASMRVAVPKDGDFTHLLLFQAPASLAGGKLIKVPNRPDLHPAGHLALLMEDGSLVTPETLSRSDLKEDAATSTTLVEQALADKGPVRIWAASVTGDGMPSPLAGPWRLNLPYAQPELPELSATTAGDTVRLDWSWGAIEPVPVVVEELQGGAWTRISPPFLSGKSGFETVRSSSPARYRLNAGVALSNEVAV
jgi:hypothetical protein